MKAINRYSFVTMMLALCMIFALQAQPQQAGAPPLRHKQIGNRGFWGQLNLTPDQKTKVAELGSNHEKAMIDLKADLEKLSIDKKDLIKKGDFDRKAITDLEEKMIKLQNKIHMASLNHRLDVVALLTPEQKEKVKNLRFWIEMKHEKQEQMKAKLHNRNKSK